jgi:hypothetical protein
MNDRTVDQAIEAAILANGLTAPRVTLDGIKAEIVSEHYINAEHAAISEFCESHSFREPVPDFSALKTLTFCVLVLKNGFTVTGESACASPENFNAEIGRQIARENAIRKVWPLLGYELRTKLAAGGEA